MNRRCSSTVRFSKRRGSSGIQASFDFAPTGSSLRSWPAMFTEPEVGGRIPLRQRSVVVLPAPLGPTRPSTSPGWTSKEMPRTASVAP